MFDKEQLQLGCRIDYVNKINLSKDRDDMIQISFIDHMIRWDLGLHEEDNHLLDYKHFATPD